MIMDIPGTGGDVLRQVKIDTPKDLMQYCRRQSVKNAIGITRIAADDYNAARCCLLNGLLTGLVYGAQAVEKMLKAHLYLGGKRVPNHHKLQDLFESVRDLYTLEQFSDLESFSEYMNLLYGHYQSRYHDNEDSSTQASNMEFIMIDKIIFGLVELLPLPEEVLFRTGLYGMIFIPIIQNSELSLSQVKWTIKHNSVLEEKYDSLLLRAQKVDEKLYPAKARAKIIEGQAN